MGQSTYNMGGRTFIAGQDLMAHRRVKIKSGTTTVPPEVEYADAGEHGIGLTQTNEKSGDAVTVNVKTERVVAADAFAVGAALFGAADGKVSDTVGGEQQYTALEAATADGDIVEAVAQYIYTPA